MFEQHFHQKKSNFKNPEMVIRIEAHTDSRGTFEYNDILSTNRAKSTYNYLISKGVNSSNITEYKGYGERRLINAPAFIAKFLTNGVIK